MSCRIRLVVPFLTKDILLRALDKIGCAYMERNGEIITRWDTLRGTQKFVHLADGYMFVNERDRRMNAEKQKELGREFISLLEREYVFMISCAQGEELAKQYFLAQQYIRMRKEDITAKAREKGYSVREEKTGDKIKLVLVRTTY